MKLLYLFISFFKIGLFSFGGGYAMIPLIQKEIIATHQWLSPNEFVDIIAIAEMTPGPIAINSATFVGYKIAGFLGSFVATTAVILPSFLIVLALATLVVKTQNNSIQQKIFKGIRPAVLALISVAAVYVAQTIHIDYKMGLIFIISLASLFNKRVHPIIVIIGSGVLGVLLL